MQNKENNSRRDFLKKLPIAVGSFIAFSSFSFKNSEKISYQKFKTISKTETNEIIKNNNFNLSLKLKPAPAPIGKRNMN